MEQGFAAQWRRFARLKVLAVVLVVYAAVAAMLLLNHHVPRAVEAGVGLVVLVAVLAYLRARADEWTDVSFAMCLPVLTDEFVSQLGASRSLTEAVVATSILLGLLLARNEDRKIGRESRVPSPFGR